MSKKRVFVGSVLASKDNPKEFYIKVKTSVTLVEGQTLRLESKEQQIAGITRAESEGKVTAEMANDIRARAEKIPDFVKFEIIMLQDR